MLPIENNNIFAIEMYTAFVPFGRKIGGITNDRWQQGRLTLLSLLYLKKKTQATTVEHYLLTLKTSIDI